MKQKLSIALLLGILFVFLFQNQAFQKIIFSDQINKFFPSVPKSLLSKNIYKKINLAQALDKINSLSLEHKKLQGKYQIYKYRFATITQKITEESKKILCPYLQRINQLTHNNFHIMDYDTVVKNIDASHNFLYLFDFFIQDVTAHYQQRLIAEIYIDTDGNRHLNFIKVSNAENRKEYAKILDTKVHGINTNQVLKKDNIKNADLQETNFKIIGIENTSLENSMLSVPMNNPYEEKSSKRNPWILHYGVTDKIISGEKAWPCGQVSSCWDTKGILINPPEKSDCTGRNTSTSKRNIVASFNPDHTVLPKDGLENGYLFDLAKGIPSFPTGISNK